MKLGIQIKYGVFSQSPVLELFLRKHKSFDHNEIIVVNYISNISSYQKSSFIAKKSSCKSICIIFYFNFKYISQK